MKNETNGSSQMSVTDMRVKIIKMLKDGEPEFAEALLQHCRLNGLRQHEEPDPQARSG